MRRYIPMALVMAGTLLLLQLMAQLSAAAPLEQGATLTYLGEGGSFTIESGLHFLVKRKRPVRFDVESGPTYTTSGDERVWATTLGSPPAYVETTVDLGFVPDGCRVTYTAIDDDPDNRINVFYVDNVEIHDMPQGMVTAGEFVVENGGNMKLVVEDSIGLWLNRCPVENTPTPTNTAVPTATPTAKLTSTPGPTSEPTNTKEPTLTPTPKPSQTPGVPEPIETVMTSTPRPTDEGATATPTKKPNKLRPPACLRINFEQSGDEAREGTYIVKELGGRLLYTWYAQEGWKDSGWIYNIHISFDSVYIQVFYQPPDGSEPIEMRIVNPAPGTTYGWLSAGKCHALEVGWPDETITPTPTPDAYDGFNDESDLRELDLLRYVWPDIQPTPTATPASSLRG